MTEATRHDEGEWHWQDILEGGKNQKAGDIEGTAPRRFDAKAGLGRIGLRPKPFQADRASTMLDIARGWPVELVDGIQHRIDGNPTCVVINE